MMRSVAALLLIIANTAYAAGDGAPTLFEYQEDQKGRVSVPGMVSKSPIDLWLEGYADALGYSYVAARMDGKPTRFCIPASGGKFKFREEIKGVINGFLTSSPVRMQPDMPLPSIIDLAFKFAYPCKTM